MGPTLFSPLRLRGTELPNRLMVAPMGQSSSPGGVATDWHLVHLGSRAVGGAGLVMTEVTATGPDAMIGPDSLGVWSDEQVDALRPVTEFVRSQGSVPAIQLGHCGRKGSRRRVDGRIVPIPPDEGGWTVGTPSGLPYPYEDVEPPATKALTAAEIRDLVDDFGRAAANAVDAGFEVVELHGAHGYLLHEFLSPVTNRRTDEYGGDYEGRTRFLREVTRAVRAAWPDDRPVFVRVSATDWLPDRESWDLEQSKRLAVDLAADGVDLLDVSAGGIHPDQRVPEYAAGYQVPLAEAVRDHLAAAGVDLAVGTVGAITSPEHADELVRNDRADLVIVGREHLRDPYFGLHAARELGVDVDWPVQYLRAKPGRN
jgi:2,4-dienoyl-CoA reductase-like NADH-dependent reductase (Old Yellow Enzyme family)